MRIPAVVETLSESTFPYMGMLILSVAASSQKSLKPFSSLPKTMAEGPLKFVSKWDLVP